MYAAKASPAPVPTIRGVKQTLDAVAKIGNTSARALQASDSDLYPTALRQAFLLVTAFRGSDIGECAEAIRRDTNTARVLLSYGKQQLFRPHSLVARYTHDLCRASGIDYPTLRNTFCK